MLQKKIAEFDICDCDWMRFDEALEQARLANSRGFINASGETITDWVLTDTQTLRALAVLKHDNLRCWSSSPYMDSSDLAWLVDFSDGYVSGNSRSYGYQVRLVRASQCLAINVAGALKSMQDAGIEIKG